MCAYNAAEDEIPVIYTAVSAPEEAGLTDGGNVTGTSDELPVAKQLGTIRAMLPEAKNIGILYTVGEANSLVQLESYKQLAGDYGFTIVESGVTSGADISLALPQLLPQVDCLTMLTDNTVVQYLEVVLDETDAAGIPVFARLRRRRGAGLCSPGRADRQDGRQSAQGRGGSRRHPL